MPFQARHALCAHCLTSGRRAEELVMANTVFVSDETVQQVLDWKEMVDRLAEAHAADLHADFAPPRTMARGLSGEWTRALCAVPAGPIMGTKFFALAAKGGGIRYCI